MVAYVLEKIGVSKQKELCRKNRLTFLIMGKIRAGLQEHNCATGLKHVNWYY